MPKYEKTQKGNPHKITINQHIIPKASIKRFSGDGGTVDIYLTENKKNKRFKPENPFFCAMRVWNQNAESGYMKDIEDSYQRLIVTLIENPLREITTDENKKISEMFALWNCRWQIETQSLPHIELKNAKEIAFNPSKEDREKLETMGVSSIYEEDGIFTISKRDIISPIIRSNIFSVVKELEGTNWKLVISDYGQFIFPDNARGVDYMPVTPNLCLIHGYEHKQISHDNLTTLNDNSISSSVKYFFANDLKKCPKKIKI